MVLLYVNVTFQTLNGVSYFSFGFHGCIFYGGGVTHPLVFFETYFCSARAIVPAH